MFLHASAASLRRQNPKCNPDERLRVNWSMARVYLCDKFLRSHFKSQNHVLVLVWILLLVFLSSISLFTCKKFIFCRVFLLLWKYIWKFKYNVFMHLVFNVNITYVLKWMLALFPLRTFSVCLKGLRINILFQIQIFGFNSQLYSNFSEALHKAQGIVSISLLLQVNLSIFYWYKLNLVIVEVILGIFTFAINIFHKW